MSILKPKSPPPEPVGFECRKCGCRHLYVVRTTPWRKKKIRRLRECRNCGFRFTTIEIEQGSR